MSQSLAATLSVRAAQVERSTKETSIQVSLSLDGGPLDLLPATEHFPEFADGASTPSSNGNLVPSAPPQTATTHASQKTSSQHIWIWTGVGFFDHMLHALAKHSGWSLRVRTKGDLAIDDHHTIEDTFLAIGTAFAKALGPREGIARYGYAYAPLDEALSRAVLDICNRPYFVGVFDFKSEFIGQMSTQMVTHGLQSFSQAAGLCLHVDVIRGMNDHHRCESAFKAVALACKQAATRDERKIGEVASTKGVL